YFFQHDHLMGVVAQTKPNGGTQATMAYRPFGEPLAETGTPVGRQRYTGREDDGTGLMYYRARYYDPGFGGFISEDPLKFRAGPNFYAYVDNNPINGNDPSGLNPVTKFIRESATYLGVKASAAAMQAAKNRAVDMAWKAVDNNPINGNDPSGLNPVTKFIRESATYLGVKASAAAMQAAKNRAVDMAWKAEIQLVQRTGEGSRDWGKAEMAYLLLVSRPTVQQPIVTSP
ncbi:hypothetical protein NMQ14_19585, partial [Methyloversatilis sp. XJ19-13]|uniref:RHS repeat-associated core domain-containing protein n=1 Tax=Methyloversatilis sp. XJ19-13 TaxID=2963430 RepID=UPI0027BA4BC6